MKLYHYTHLENWNKIKYGHVSYKNYSEANLQTKTLLARDYLPARIKVLSALLEPQPEQWLDSEFTNIWTDLKSHVGLLLLEIEPDLNTTYILDRARLQAYFDRNIDQIYSKLPEEFHVEDRETAERKMFETMIPLHYYLQDPEAYGYLLPEVAITQPISLDRISVSKQQPLLEEELAITDPERHPTFRQQLIKSIVEIPELNVWVDTYSESHPDILVEISKYRETQEGSLNQRRK